MWIETKLSGTLNSDNIVRVQKVSDGDRNELVFILVGGANITELYNTKVSLNKAYEGVMEQLNKKYLKG